MKKIAIFHNFLDNIGGAEIVTLYLSRELNADIYTTNFNPEKIREMGFDAKRIFSIGKIPINSPFKQEFAYWRFRLLNLKNKYDFYIISGDWAMSGAVNNKPNLWYVHSPTREIWDLYKYTRKFLVKWWQRPLFDIWVLIRRIMNKSDVKKVERFVCSSINVRKRLKKYLNRNAVIISPPVETNKFYYKENSGFWLSVNRLTNYKRIEMQLKAFEKLPNEKLIILGPHEKSQHFIAYTEYCNKIKPKNVEIISKIEREKLIDFYANCKGFITTSKDEDFGITPVEAMAAGKAVIAPNEGGYKETIINNKTGILIDNIDENKLTEAIINIGKEIDVDPLKFRNICQEQARKFDVEIFIQKIKEQIK